MPKPIDEKSLAPYKAKVNEIQVAASEYSITRPEDLETGADLLHDIKAVKKALTVEKEKVTRPLMSALGQIRDWFKPLEMTYTEAEKTVKEKMLEFQEAEDARIEKAKASDIARVERGTMKIETALSRSEDRGEAPKSAEGVVGKIQTREIPKLEIFDETVLPREFLCPDREKIFTALKAGTEVAGARIRMERIIAGR